MPPSWSFVGVQKGNEVIWAKAAKPSVTGSVPLTAAPDAIESLRQELLEIINKQGKNISALEVSNATLTSSNAALTSKVNELTDKANELTLSHSNMSITAVSLQFSMRYYSSLKPLFLAAFKNNSCTKPPHGA